MLQTCRELYDYRELVATLAWKNIAVRYKQAYLGLAWAVLKPLALMAIFTLVRSFIGIDTGNLPYPLVVFTALTVWIFFQESASDGVNSVVGNTALVRKIYFPREVFPLTSVATKLVELGVGMVILTILMALYGLAPTAQVVWVPLLVLYAALAALTVSLFGAAVNVYYRDVGQALPVLLSLTMFLSPIIYPLTLVRERLLVQQAAGEWSNLLFTLYTLNPLAGIVDGMQNALLRGTPPDWPVLLPGALAVAVLLPLSYLYFKRAEAHFADVI